MFNCKVKLVVLAAVFLLSISCQETTKVKKSIPVERIESSLRIKFNYGITWDPGVSRVDLVMVIPSTIEDRQVVENIEYSFMPDKVFMENGNTYAQFIIQTRKYKDRRLQLFIDCDITLLKLNSNTNAAWKGFEEKLIYSQPEAGIESDALEIVDLAKSMKGADTLATLNNIHNFVNRTIRPELNLDIEYGALDILYKKTGDCSEFSTLTMALTRASLIPVMSIYCISTRAGILHSINEVYIPEYGWVPFDTTVKTDDILKIKNIYIYLANMYRWDAYLENFFPYKYTSKASSPEKNATITFTYAILK